MYEQAQPVRSPVSGPGNSQTSGPPSRPPAVRQCGQHGRVRHGNGAPSKWGEELEMSSDKYEDAEVVNLSSTFREARMQRAKLWGDSLSAEGSDARHARRYGDLPNTADASTDSTYPGGASGRRVLRDFVRSYRGCMAGTAVGVATVVIVGLVLMVFINKAEMSQLSDTVDALKRHMESERNRSAALVACLRNPISCLEGYQLWRGMCYKVFDTPKSFYEASSTCCKDGGTLAMPRDAETNTFLISLHKPVKEHHPVLFGLHDHHEEGRFEWVDGSALGTYNSWAPNEPDGIGDCVGYGPRSMWKDIKWTNYKCDRRYPFICQVIPGHKCGEVTA
ncbi:uncharacterized protein [Branchiostoma lanceolatum]|uniref:uncharacterized protein n=1 Tax=Branchiostoma lanceolatum TaxID=7740 RepID=UPI00345326CA